MPHPYPPHHPDLPYVGKHSYFLTFRTFDSRHIFTTSEVVDLVVQQFLRAGDEQGVELTAYCFMPDHLHLLVRGQQDGSDCRAFIRAAKQYSGYYFTRRHGTRLWQRYGFERVIRDDLERAFAIGYIVANPVRARLVGHPSQFPYVGSQPYTVLELLEMCEYSKKWVG
jgi:REP-associated tyrosine transposase